MKDADHINVSGHRWEARQTKPAVEPRVVSAFRRLWPTDLVMKVPATHWYWVLDYFYEPGARFCGDATGTTWRTRTPGVVHLYRPHAPSWHDATTSSKAVSSCYMSLCGGDAANLGDLVPTGLKFAQFEDPDHLFRDLQDEIIDIGRIYQDPGFLRAQGVLYQILDLLFRARKIRRGVYVIEKEWPAHDGDVLVKRTRAYLQAHLGEAVRIVELARHVGVSISALERRYKAQTGESPIRTLIRLRVDAVKALLIQGSSVKTAAEVTGFCDTYHLSRVFQGIEGIRPTEFLRRVRRTN